MSNYEKIRQFEGKVVKISFQNGFGVYSRNVEVYPKEGEPEYLICGPTDLKNSEGKNIAVLDQYILPLGDVIAVKEILRKVEAAKGAQALSVKL